MKIDLEDLSDVQKKVKVEIPWEQVRAEFDRAYNKLRRQVDIKGFRRGKAPRSILERYYKDRVSGETEAKLMSESFEKALSEHNIEMITEPAFTPDKIEEGKPFSYSITVEVHPEIELTDYKNISVEREKLSVSEEMVEEQMEKLRQGQAELRVIEEDRAARPGDFAVIDYKGTLDGKPFRDGRDENALIEVRADAAEHSFNRALIGLEKGKTHHITITYPDDFGRKDLAGREVEFDVTVNEIKERVLPDLDDEFARSLGDFTSLNDFREKVREEVDRREQQRVDRDMEERLFRALIERSPFQVPRSLVEASMDEMVTDMRNRFEGPAGQAQSAGIDWLSVRQNFEEGATYLVKRDYIIKRIIELEGLSIEEADVEAEIEEIAKKSNRSVEMIKGVLQKNNGLARLRDDLLRKKGLDFILKNAKIIDKEHASLEAEVKP